jgi:Methyltransferase domain
VTDAYAGAGAPRWREARAVLQDELARVVKGVAGRLAALAERLAPTPPPSEPTPATAESIPAPVESVPAPAGTPMPLYGSFHDLLHAQRSVELSRMPRGNVLLSAGCSGSWYFAWIERWYGPVTRHIGIEQYLRRPEALPANVEWIATSVAAMPQVGDGAVDVVFSGQNIEHLFAEDAVGFLLECARVVHAGGHLVIDSPHREIANLLQWSMAEHTIEFTPAEACELVALAGFDVTDVRGVWLCREPDTGAALPLDPYAAGASADEIVRRVQLAPRYPDDAFVWWLEARRTERAPDADALRRRHAEIFEVAWPERCRRLLSQVGERRREDGRQVVTTPAGVVGYLLYGPFMPFAAGRYQVTFTLRRDCAAESPETVVAVLDAVTEGDDPCLARREIRAGELPPGQWTDMTLEFASPALRWTGQLRAFSPGVAALAVDTAVAVDDRGTAMWPPRARVALAAG